MDTKPKPAESVISDGDELVAARGDLGYAIPTYDGGLGRLWVLRDSTGIMGICRARTWEDAYSICEDEFFPEADEPSLEAIAREYECSDVDSLMDNACFQEAYGFRPNGANIHDTHGHGIYQRDLNGEALDMLTAELATDLHISLTIYKGSQR